MGKNRLQSLAVIAAGFAAFLAISLVTIKAQQPTGAGVKIKNDDIGGVVTSSKGPEAGVWVIAETKDLPTKFARIVVTDDQGRYLIPDLPRASYTVFARGYGLLDSKRQPASLGQKLDLKAEVAPDAKAAAQIYPAAWWLSMLKFPDDKQLHQKLAGNIAVCFSCHEVGTKITRELGSISSAGATSSLDAWDRRTMVGPSGPGMSHAFHALGEARQMFADWTDRIAKGEVPVTAPERPTGVERNLVISEWDWGMAKDGRSDVAASDTRTGRANANGLVFEASEHTDTINILDPVQNKSEVIKVPTEAPPMAGAPLNSPYAGADPWKRSADPRSVNIDGKGRVWVGVRNREPAKQPAFCGPGSNKFGNFYPLKQSGRQVSVYDPKTKEWQFIDTCFSADHNQIAKDNFIYFGFGAAIGWIDINTWDKTHDAEASQGWCPGVIDTNGDGKISTGWTEPNEPIDPTKDHRIDFGAYTNAFDSKDGSIWVSGLGRQEYPVGDKRLVRISKGSNPPETCRTEFFEPPPGEEVELFGTGGIEADDNGVVWENWRVSGQVTAFDRSKCKSTSDPKLTGQSCPEGWTIYRKNDPTYRNSLYKSEMSYLSHMDVHDTLGFGKDAPIYGSANTDALILFDQKTKQFVTLRVPYPLGFDARSANGRIDDPKTGWKGKGYWADYASYANWHIEGAYGTLPKAVKFQMRPNPLAD
jgi:hypothetical protein